jgi:hypothetical protein
MSSFSTVATKAVVEAYDFSGIEMTAAEYEDLFRRAGLRLTRIVPTKSPYSVIEAVAA